MFYIEQCHQIKWPNTEVNFRNKNRLWLWAKIEQQDPDEPFQDNQEGDIIAHVTGCQMWAVTPEGHCTGRRTHGQCLEKSSQQVLGDRPVQAREETAGLGRNRLQQREQHPSVRAP